MLQRELAALRQGLEAAHAPLGGVAPFEVLYWAYKMSGCGSIFVNMSTGKSACRVTLLRPGTQLSCRLTHLLQEGKGAGSVTMVRHSMPDPGVPVRRCEPRGMLCSTSWTRAPR